MFLERRIPFGEIRSAATGNSDRGPQRAWVSCLSRPEEVLMRPAVRLPFHGFVRALSLAGALVATACSGAIGGAGAGSAGAGSSKAGASGGVGTTGAGGVSTTGTGGDPVLGTCPTGAVTPTPLRRLTRFEYANA